MEASDFGRRKHGDPFPLPMGSSLHDPTRVDGVLRGLNRLAGFESQNSQQPSCRPQTAVQKLVLHRVSEAVLSAGECPAGVTPDSALQDLARTNNLYEGEPNNLVNFDASKLKILQSQVRPKPLMDLLPPHVLPLLKRRKTSIERPASDVAADLDRDFSLCPKNPYWDPILRTSTTARDNLFCGLHKVGVIDFRTRIKAKVGLFFVKKKDPRYIRMVVDGRIPNFHHRSPPVTRLGSGANFMELDLSDDLLTTRLPGSEGKEIGFGTELDVSDAFYQFQVAEMAQWFGIDYPKPVRYWKKLGVNIQRVFDDDSGSFIDLNDDSVVYPTIAAMSMGWSWALFLANEVIASVAVQTQPEYPLEMREKLPVPQIWEADSIVSTYVDNVCVVGATAEGVEARAKKLTDAFASLDIPVVWSYDSPQRKFETVGVVLDFEQKRVSNKPSRLWKVYQASRALIQRSKVRGELVEIWLGHATSIFRLAPHFLSAFSHIYRFCEVARGRRVCLWPSVRAEIRLAGDLVWLAFCDLGGNYVRHLDMGDSANNGYSLLTRNSNSSELYSISRFREKWRYISLPEDLKNHINAFRDGLEQDDTGPSNTIPSFIRSGVGIDTEYGKWLQEALVEGSWLKTSAIVSQYKAKRRRRIDVACPAVVPPLPSDVVDPGTYKILWARPWRNPEEHINLKEGRVLLSSLKRTCRVASLFGCKKVSLSDNLVSVLAFEKGRSSRGNLNKLCQRAAGFVGATGVKWRIRHVETKRNVADFSSRLFEGKNKQLGGLRQRGDKPLQSRNFVCDPQTTCFWDGEDSSSESVPSRSSTRIQLSLSDLLGPPGLGTWTLHEKDQSCSCASRKCTPSRGEVKSSHCRLSVNSATSFNRQDSEMLGDFLRVRQFIESTQEGKIFGFGPHWCFGWPWSGPFWSSYPRSDIRSYSIRGSRLYTLWHSLHGFFPS